MSLPCRICGGPKEPGRGRKLCASCCEKEYYASFTARGRKPRPRVLPCKRCGGPKVPEGQHASRGQRFCAACKVITQAEAIERKRVRDLERYTPKRKSERVAPKPRVKVERKPKVKVAPKPRVVRAKAAPKVQAPSQVRSLWRSSHPNSQIKRLYPTVEKLNQAYRDGALRGYEHAARRLP